MKRGLVASGWTYFVLAIGGWAILTSGCRSKQESAKSDLSSSWLLSGVDLPEEPYPFNSMPMERLSQDADGDLRGQPLPPVVPVRHRTQLPQHGVRYMQTNRDISKYIRPGDIFVRFEPIGSSNFDPMMLLEKGMYHAGIVIANHEGEGRVFFPSEDSDAFLCHFDITGEYDPSGCGFIGPTHFFRVLGTDHSQVQDAVAKIFKNWKYDYLFKLSIQSTGDISTYRKSLKPHSKQSMYCSELPFTIHALATDKLPVTPISVSQILADFNEFRDKFRGLYAVDLNDDVMTGAIVDYFSMFLPDSVDSLLDNRIARSYIKSALAARPDNNDQARGIAARRLIPPWSFMDESKTGSGLVRYVGTYFPGEHKAVAVPVDALKRLTAVKSQIENANRRIDEASANIAAATFVEKVNLPPAGLMTKNRRLIQWVRRKPRERTLLTDFRTINGSRKAVVANLFEQMKQVELTSNLEYLQFVDICDTFKYSSNAIYDARSTLVMAMQKLKADRAQIASIEVQGAGDDMRLLQSWEDLGCSLASRSAYENALSKP